MKKKFDRSLFVACLCGGILGSIIASLVLLFHEDTWNPVLIVGTFFAIVSFFICFSGWIMELLTRNLSKNSGSIVALGRSLLILGIVPVAFFILGVLLQFLYGLGKVKTSLGKADNYLIIVDNSGSASATDPMNERFSSIVDFAANLKTGEGIMVTVFDHRAEIVFPFTTQYVGIDLDIGNELEKYYANGGTDIQLALEETLRAYGNGNGRNTVALLFSDGESTVDLKRITQAYQNADIPIFTISFAKSGWFGRNLLESLAERTGGDYFEIGSGLSFEQSYKKVQNFTVKRNLLSQRGFGERKSIGYGFLRIFFITVLVSAILPCIALALDSEEVLRKNLIPKIAEGFSVALLMELGFGSFWNGTFLRIVMGVFMSLIFAWYILPDIDEYVEEIKNTNDYGSLFDTSNKNNSYDFGSGSKEEKKYEIGFGKK